MVAKTLGKVQPKLVLLPLVAVVLLGVAAFVAISARADVVVPDGDVVTPGYQGSQYLGVAVAGQVIAVPVDFSLECFLASHVDDGQTVSIDFSLTNSSLDAGAVTTADLSATNTSIGPVPAAWPDDGDACGDPAPDPLGDNGDSTVTVTAPAAPGVHTFVVSYMLSLTPAGINDPSALIGTLTAVTFTMVVGPFPCPPPVLPSGSPVTIGLWASEGSVSMPDGTPPIPIWGFTGMDPITNLCTANLPGPVLEVDEGADVTVELHNLLDVNLALAFPGQDLVPDTVGAPPGGTASYTFIADDPGTYLYEAGTAAQEDDADVASCSDGVDNGPDGLTDGADPECAGVNSASVQVPMGLYGALIVRPATANQAYDGAVSAYDVEAPMVLSEIDPALNNGPAGFSLGDYDPKYWLINGKAYPETDSILANPGERVLFRYLNAGLWNHTMQLLGLHQQVIAGDAHLLNFAYEVDSLTVASGQTYDLIGILPGGTPAGTQYPLYSAQQHVNNADEFPGGMLTFVVDSPLALTASCGQPAAMTDALVVARHVVGLRPTLGCAWNGDVTRDGRISMGDALAIARYVVGFGIQ